MEFNNLHEVLRSLYDEMLPLSADMAAVAKGLAGLGALFYVATKVWQALSRAEPIDIYPLLRPFALGLCIMFFPTIVLGTLNAVLSPVVQGTHAILENQVLDLNDLQAKKDMLEREAMLRDPPNVTPQWTPLLVFSPDVGPLVNRHGEVLRHPKDALRCSDISLHSASLRSVRR